MLRDADTPPPSYEDDADIALVPLVAQPPSYGSIQRQLDTNPPAWNRDDWTRWIMDYRNQLGLPSIDFAVIKRRLNAFIHWLKYTFEVDFDTLEFPLAAVTCSFIFWAGFESILPDAMDITVSYGAPLIALAAAINTTLEVHHFSHGQSFIQLLDGIGRMFPITTFLAQATLYFITEGVRWHDHESSEPVYISTPLALGIWAGALTIAGLCSRQTHLLKHRQHNPQPADTEMTRYQRCLQQLDRLLTHRIGRLGLTYTAIAGLVHEFTSLLQEMLVDKEGTRETITRLALTFGASIIPTIPLALTTAPNSWPINLLKRTLQAMSIFVVGAMSYEIAEALEESDLLTPVYTHLLESYFLSLLIIVVPLLQIYGMNATDINHWLKSTFGFGWDSHDEVDEESDDEYEMNSDEERDDELSHLEAGLNPPAGSPNRLAPLTRGRHHSTGGFWSQPQEQTDPATVAAQANTQEIGAEQPVVRQRAQPYG